MAAYELIQYLIFLLFLPIGILGILRGKFYLATFAAVIAFIDLIFLGLKITGVA